MKTTFNKEEVQNPQIAKHLVALIDSAKHGGFMRVIGFKGNTTYVELANYTYCKGISYPAAIKKSLEILTDMEKNQDFSITVTRGVWTNEANEVSPTGRKSKDFPIPATLSKTYKTGDATLLEAFAKVRKSLEDPKEMDKVWNKEGNGVYSDDNGRLYLRDLRLVSKNVIVHGEYPFKASGELVALADAIEKDMPKGKYRNFALGSDFDAINLDGMELTKESEIVTEVKQEVSAVAMPKVPETV